ncbi:hypothetical protein IKF92_02120 [Candidatus Saccharibacteria bacterium]|nr:hypothetical protein [Candidatus Saccharibacteria bacterium]
MDDYLIDRQTLGQFVDALIKKKALPGDNEDELNNVREGAIKSLDDRICLAIFGSFDEKENAEFNQMLNRDATESEYENFFNRIGLNIRDTISNAMKSFAFEFLGGQNEN